MIGQTHHFRIGEWECSVICDTEEHLAASWLLASVPTEALKGALDAGGYQQTLDFSMNLLVLRQGQHTILVDTGLPSQQTLPQYLKAAGIDPAAIDRVIITHGDDDHMGGSAYEDGVLTYPNARYSMSKVEWEYRVTQAEQAEDPNLVARRCLAALEGRIDLLEAEAEIVPGVTALFTPGHTPGHISVLVESQGERLVQMGDAIHHPMQIAHPDWTPDFEWDRRVSAQTREGMVERAAAERWLLMAYHFPFPGYGRVMREGSSYRWQPVQR